MKYTCTLNNYNIKCTGVKYFPKYKQAKSMYKHFPIGIIKITAVRIFVQYNVYSTVDRLVHILLRRVTWNEMFER